LGGQVIISILGFVGPVTNLYTFLKPPDLLTTDLPIMPVQPFRRIRQTAWANRHSGENEIAVLMILGEIHKVQLFGQIEFLKDVICGTA
jgi:hypothetical protein